MEVWDDFKIDTIMSHNAEGILEDSILKMIWP